MSAATLAIDKDKFLPEAEAVATLKAARPYSERDGAAITQLAAGWVETLRAEPQERTLLDTFLSEYGLSNEEGVALMCLAEAFLRVPDDATANDLILDKLLNRDWEAHSGTADSWLVNASTWALMLTGKTLKPTDQHPSDWLTGIVSRLGKPVVQQAVRSAMQILGGEFVLGETIAAALERGKMSELEHYSFDMLGEGARDQASAARYATAYAEAITAVGAAPPGNTVSIKLSALHPRYEALQLARLQQELLPRLLNLCQLAQRDGVGLTVDAEEADRLTLSLTLFEALYRAPELNGWPGLGMVVQAYGKRALPVIAWLESLAQEGGRNIPVRLVKGAYWDAEIKQAQQAGFADYPVYTRKAHTDMSYLVCARRLLDAEGLTPQFATHNAHTVAAISHMAGARRDFEFQRLHGMGEHLYKVVRRSLPDLKLRVYAPVGQHKDLLAYLVRRLLENGANSSFVNRLHDATLPAADLASDPFAIPSPADSYLRTPPHLFPDRLNSAGVDLSQAELADRYKAKGWEASPVEVSSLTAARDTDAVDVQTHVSPADTSVEIARVQAFPVQAAEDAFTAAVRAQIDWDARGGRARAALLHAFAEQLEAAREDFYTLLCHEAGKTLGDAVDEVREAVDFCRFYAALAEQQFAGPVALPGPAGEANTLALQGRGVFVCISPWNFPLAIFVGQIAAALASGNAVIAKPAETTPVIACRAVTLLHAAGVPLDTCQLVLGDAELGRTLVAHPACAGVAFTGSTEVARLINQQLADRPGPIVPLIAETGGQNAMIVDSTALLEQVTDDVIRSAFGASGQRCSALRLLYLQEDIADEALALIRGAMAELRVAHPEDPATDVGPIISKAARAVLEAHLDKLRDAGLAVYQAHTNLPASGFYFAPTLVELENLALLEREVFGPILHVRRFSADAVDEVINEINGTGYGLTLGIHTRIDQRAERWARRLSVGNVYVNRNMIGAVVGSQPFGGRGLSGTGPKAGGPHYLQRFATEQTVSVNTAARGGDVGLLSGDFG